jgi:hypothetical protein
MKNVLASSVVGLLVVACGGSDDGAASEAPPAAGADGGAPVVVVPPDAAPIGGGCDVSKLPSDDACVLHESVGVFVSAKGADANDGSRLRPYATIAKGIEAAKATSRRVYVCAESYAETSLVLANGISMFGNLTCAGAIWTVGTTHAVLNASANPAARATDIVTETRIEGLDLVAPAGAASGESSIGLIVQGSNGLHFMHSAITAQSGGAGANGVEGVQFPGAFDGEEGANVGSCTPNGANAITPFSCPNRRQALGGAGVCEAGGVQIPTNPGGIGGAPAALARNGSVYEYAESRFCGVVGGGTCWITNDRGYPIAGSAATATGANATYAPGRSITPSSTSIAATGAPGASGSDGANAVSLGAISAAGYLAANGVVGGNGEPGQGGGGGYAGGVTPLMFITPPQYASGPGGGGGGSGGCPGVAGSAGAGGGASIAILSSNSSLHLDGTVLTAGVGGMGGQGNLGSAPTAGGMPGVGAGSSAAAGGTGGVAGWSGHGASGPSFAIAWTTAQPVVAADSTLTVPPPSAGQAALTGNGKTIPAMPAAVAEKVHAF